MIEKSRANRARRAAVRQGLRLEKSRRRDPRALDFDRYWLLDKRSGKVVFGGEHGRSLDDIEAQLMAAPARSR